MSANCLLKEHNTSRYYERKISPDLYCLYCMGPLNRVFLRGATQYCLFETTIFINDSCSQKGTVDTLKQAFVELTPFLNQ